MSSVFIGIDLGGTNTKFALADSDGNVVARESIPTDAHEGPSGVLKRIADRIAMIADQHSATSLGGIGMGVPGLVDIERGVTRFLPNLETQWPDVAVAEPLAKRFQCPVRLLNDARTATLGELRFGHGKTLQRPTLIFLSLGTGVGGGVVIDGLLRLGTLGAAGEIGHQTLLPDGPRCGCGNRGCLETLASGPAIASEGTRLMHIGLAPHLYDLVDGHGDNVTPHQMAIAADHDPAVAEAIAKAGDYIGIALANVITILHPDLVVVGGGVAQFGPLLFDPIRDAIRDRVHMFPTDSIQVVPSKLGDSAGVMGAIALAIHSDTNLSKNGN